jgi:hypothetical protein
MIYKIRLKDLECLAQIVWKSHAFAWIVMDMDKAQDILKIRINSNL